MKFSNFLLPILGFGMLTLPSCLDDDDSYVSRMPTALVTVCPNADGSFIMQLDNNTQLEPANMKKSPFGDKEVRALVNYSDAVVGSGIRRVHVNWLDSIRTKLPVESLADRNDEVYGNDPIEIIRDWVTVAEDGYITLRIRTRWGTTATNHYVNLLTGTNPDDPYEFELRHDANDDVWGEWGDALIAFNLNNLPRPNGDDVKIKLKWKSFDGDKTAEFDLKMRPVHQDIDAASIRFSRSIE